MLLSIFYLFFVLFFCACSQEFPIDETNIPLEFMRKFYMSSPVNIYIYYTLDVRISCQLKLLYS